MDKDQEQIEVPMGLDIHVLESLVVEGCNNIPTGIKQAVLVIGDTGSGKSTLINALIEKKLTAVSLKKGMKKTLILKNSEDGPKIGDTSVSETTVPKIWQDKNGVAYFDCPGFEDTKGAEQDIANGVFVNKLFKSIDQVKIVLVVSQNQLTSDRAKDVIKLIKKITAMFPNKNQISNSVSLVVSKADVDTKTQDVKEELLDIIKDHENDKSSTTFYTKINSKIDKMKGFVGMGVEKQLNEVGHMWTMIANSNICVFHVPTQEGNYIMNKDITNSINHKTTYAKKPDVNIAISDQSKLLITSAYDHLIKSTASKIKALGKDIEEFRFKFTDSGNIEENLISILIKIKNILSNINSDRLKHEVDKHNIAEFSGKLFELNKILGIKQDSISPSVEMFSLLKRVVNEGINQEVSECLKGFNDLDAKIIKEVTKHTNSLKNTIICNIDGLIQSAHDGILEFSSIEKQKLKSQIQLLNKFQNMNYIEKAVELFYNAVPNDQTKSCRDATLNSIKLIRDINTTLQQDQIVISSAEMQSGIALIMNGMLLSEQELEEKKLKIEKTKAIVDISCYPNKVNESDEPNSIKLTGNKLIVDEKYVNQIVNFHKEIKSENIYLNYGKYTFIFGISSIQFDHSIKVDSGNLFICAPLIKFSPGVEFNLSGKDGISYVNSVAFDGTWNSSAAFGNMLAILSMIPYVNIAALPLAVAYDIQYNKKQPSYRKAGTDGNPGKDGEPGFPGGNMIMLSYNYQGLEGLKIDVSGGKGGDGGKGGNGGSCNESYLTAPEARAGGDGGKGGDAGKGGKCGFIEIFKMDKNKKTEDVSKHVNLKASSVDGIPGKGGEGGIGWKGKIATSGVDGSKGSIGKFVDEVKEFSFIDLINQNTVKDFYTTFVSEAPNQGPDVETLGELGYVSFVG